MPVAAHSAYQPADVPSHQRRRVGLIGAGAIARVHAAQWRKLPIEMAGCYDRHPERAAAFCGEFGGRPFASLEEMLASIDILTVCTHTDSHKEIVLAAVAAGVAIVCEKPIARHLADAEEMVAACAAANVPLFVAQVLRFFPAYAAAKATLDQGVIGRPGAIRTTRAGSFPRKGGAFGSPFYADFRRSGGVILDLAIHDIDFQRWIAGDVTRVFARGLTFRGLAADHAYISLRFRSGAVGHIDANWALPPGLFRTRLEIAGDQGLMEWDSFQPAPVIAVFKDEAVPGGTRHQSASPVAAQDEPYYAQLAHFLACLDSGTPFLVRPDDAVQALKVALAAIHSVRTGLPVDLTDFNAHAAERELA